MVGAETTKIHINDLCKNPKILSDFHILDLIGGFSDGDHIAAGKVHANRLRYKLGEELKKFIDEGKLIIGICNGFQHLVKAGFLPGFDGDYSTQKLTLACNDSGKYEDRWVHLKVNKESICIFTRGVDELYLPIRHGEGKIRIKDRNVLEKLKQNNQIVLQYANKETGEPTMDYPHNPNGSDEAIAGICDATGRVFGMMPHREAFWSPFNHPNWTRLKTERKLSEEGGGLVIFKNAVDYLKRKL